MNFKKIAVIAAMDVLLLAELTWSIYLGQQDPEAVALVFMKNFLPLAALTVLAARLILKRYFSEPPVTDPNRHSPDRP